jgi:hypothetical protein
VRLPDAFAALVYRTSEVPDEALSLGFAMALAGHDLSRPVVEIADLGRGWSAAFYESGRKGGGHTPEDELEHLLELFDDEDLPPGAAVHSAAIALGAPPSPVHALLYAPADDLDEGYRFGGLADDRDEIVEHEEEEDGEDERGTVMLARALEMPVVAPLMKALFEADRSLVPVLAKSDPASMERLTRELVETLSRRPGRGVPALSPAWGAPVPAAYEAFARVYDWADPRDPADLYREVAIGNIVGTLRFLRPESGLLASPPPRGAGVDPPYPFAELLSSNLGDPRHLAVLALARGGDAIVSVTSERRVLAGPSLGELVRYLALGYRARTVFEEELIQCLLLRAAVRVADDRNE